MALRETTNQYIFFILSQLLLVYIGLIGLLPRLSSLLCRYVSFQFHMPYAFMVFASIPLFTHFFIGFGPITGIIYRSGEVPIGASIVIPIHFLLEFWFALGWYCTCSRRYLENVFFVWFCSGLDW